jgi:protease IV
MNPVQVQVPQQQQQNLKFYQRSPLGFGLLILAGLFLIFLVLVVATSASNHSESKVVANSLSFGSKVAVIKVEGEIVSSDQLLKDLRSYRDNNSVKAIVLRVDSPGGLPAPSQEMYEELKRYKKPVVASMGSLAASGAYYICLPCKYIYASPATLTGSIGVIMQTTNVEELMKWLKIQQGVIKSGEFKDAGTPFRPMTDSERAYFQSVIDSVFGQFKAAVQESRKIQEPKLSEISNGRVFTGEQAKELGLIDGLGNIEDAIKKAGELGGIKGEPQVIWPMKRYSFWEALGSETASAFFNRLTSLSSNPVWFLMPGINLPPNQGANHD